MIACLTTSRLDIKNGNIDTTFRSVRDRNTWVQLDANVSRCKRILCQTLEPICLIGLECTATAYIIAQKVRAL
jgi:hypothetical protein